MDFDQVFFLLISIDDWLLKLTGLISANSDMRFESLSLSRNSMETSTSYYSAQDSVTTSSDIGRGRGLLGEDSYKRITVLLDS